jgi:protein gp37
LFNNKNNIGKTKYWHPWKGCHKISLACKNCFIKHMDDFILGEKKCPETDFGENVIVCLHSDFFIEEADPYRAEAWQQIKQHNDTIFIIITKRVERIMQSLPNDWGNGYNNVVISVTVENQKLADQRLELFKQIPCKHRWISCCPLIAKIDLTYHLQGDEFEHIECCGETGLYDSVRATLFEYVDFLSEQCKKYNKRFSFMKVGSKFVYNNAIYSEQATCYHSPLADMCSVDNYVPIIFNLNSKQYVM